MTLQSRSILDRELSALDADLLRLASMVDLALEQAMEALSGRDFALAQAVIDQDEEINALRFEVEQNALLILATQQPAAIDLRTVIVAMHVATELERIGDHAAGIARLVARMEGEPEIDTLHKLPKMARRARKMVEESIEAYVHRDPELARELVRRDDKLDRHYNQLFRETIEEMRAEDYARRATFLLWVGHNLERIGDRATNIAERVIFLTTGQFVENIVSMEEPGHSPE